MKSALAIAVVVATTTLARAECPTTPDDKVCRPWAAVMLPTAFGVFYAPSDAGGPWYGGGIEAVTT